MSANPNQYKLSERTGKLTAKGKKVNIKYNVLSLNDKSSCIRKLFWASLF